MGSSVDIISDGTKLTVEELYKSCKPYLIIEVSNNDKNEINVNQVIDLLRSNDIKVLNMKCENVSPTQFRGPIPNGR